MTAIAWAIVFYTVVSTSSNASVHTMGMILFSLFGVIACTFMELMKK